MATIASRRGAAAEKSYTASLFAGGLEKIGGKIEEEAREAVEAAGEDGEDGRRHLVHEAADLLYHLLVLLAFRGVSLQEVEAELARREAQSGHEEKAKRGARP